MKLIRALLILTILFTFNIPDVFSFEDWLSFGGTGENDINNNRNSDKEFKISTKNVGSLEVINTFKVFLSLN